MGVVNGNVSFFHSSMSYLGILAGLGALLFFQPGDATERAAHLPFLRKIERELLDEKDGQEGAVHRVTIICNLRNLQEMMKKYNDNLKNPHFFFSEFHPTGPVGEVRRNSQVYLTF